MGKKLSENMEIMLIGAYRQWQEDPEKPFRGFPQSTETALRNRGLLRRINPLQHRLTDAGREAARELLAGDDEMPLDKVGDLVATLEPEDDNIQTRYDEWNEAQQKRHEASLDAQDDREEYSTPGDIGIDAAKAQPDPLDTRGLAVEVDIEGYDLIVRSKHIAVRVLFPVHETTIGGWASVHFHMGHGDEWREPRYHNTDPSGYTPDEIRNLANALQVAADIADKGAEWVIEHEAMLTGETVIDCAADGAKYEQDVEPGNKDDMNAEWQQNHAMPDRQTVIQGDKLPPNFADMHSEYRQNGFTPATFHTLIEYVGTVEYRLRALETDVRTLETAFSDMTSIGHPRALQNSLRDVPEWSSPAEVEQMRQADRQRIAELEAERDELKAKHDAMLDMEGERDALRDVLITVRHYFEGTIDNRTNVIKQVNDILNI